MRQCKQGPCRKTVPLDHGNGLNRKSENLGEQLLYGVNVARSFLKIRKEPIEVKSVRPDLSPCGRHESTRTLVHFNFFVRRRKFFHPLRSETILTITKIDDKDVIGSRHRNHQFPLNRSAIGPLVSLGARTEASECRRLHGDVLFEPFYDGLFNSPTKKRNGHIE